MTMIRAARGLHMAKKRQPASATMKIDPDLLRKAKQVAAIQDIHLQDYIDGLLRGPIEKDHARAVRKLIEDTQGEATSN